MVFHTWYLLKRTDTLTTRKKDLFIGFSFIQLFFFTLMIATNGVTQEFMWIDHRDFPGGPMGYFAAAGSSWWGVLNVVCGVLSLAMTDALLASYCFPLAT